MSPFSRFAVQLILPFAVLLATPAAAQVLTIGSDSVRRGNSIDIPVRFAAGSAAVVAYNMAVVYDPSRFDPPTCIAHNGAICGVNHSLGRVALFHFDLNLAPIPSGTYMTIRFPAARTAVRGASPLGARSIDFATPLGNRVDGTIYTGTIMIR